MMDEAERNIQRKTPEALPRYREAWANISWELIPDPDSEQARMWIGVIVAKDAPVLAAAGIAYPHRRITLGTKNLI
ncbi:MAG TPA: hypothetical protein VHP83_18595 [Aggregatilineaceae bacterium]|nr:hypothetical protein [Aggregatilineaceae bacterium]